MDGVRLNWEIIDKVLVIYLPRILGHMNSIDVGQEIVLTIRKEPGELSVLFNCKNLAQINNSGLRVFVIALQKLKQTGRKLNLCHVAVSVLRFFEEAGVLSEFSLYDTQEKALEDMRARK